MKRPLFVFAGQSNMMGAAVFEATRQIHFKNSFEYLHKPKRFGSVTGDFKNFGFPAGEFSYMDLKQAYGKNPSVTNLSELGDFRNNTYFCPSMNNLKDREEKSTCPFADFTEANNRMAVSLPPFVVEKLEEAGYSCAYTHIAKGSAPIKHFLEGAAADYFLEKITDFFADCARHFPEDDMTEKVLVWLQGESDVTNGYDYYYSSLVTLWEKVKPLGFTKFFMIRVDPFGSPEITEIMRAQEDFCKNFADAYMLTRIASYFPLYYYPGKQPLVRQHPECDACRDSYYGFANEHINEKGFELLTKYITPNIIRILYEGKEPVLEEELIPELL